MKALWSSPVLLIVTLLLVPHLFASGNGPQRGDPDRGEGQIDVYRRAIKSAERVQDNANTMVPSRRLWVFDRERERQHLDELRAAAQVLQRDQAAFEASLTPEQMSRFDSQVHSFHQFRAELEFRLHSLDHELQKRQPERWHLASDASAISKLVKEWKKQDRKVAKGIGMEL